MIDRLITPNVGGFLVHTVCTSHTFIQRIKHVNYGEYAIRNRTLYCMFDSQILTGEDWNEVMYDGIVSQGGHR